MSILTKQVGFTIEIDTESIAPMSANVFIYNLLNKLNYENKVTSITVDGVTVDTTAPDALYNLPLGEDQDLA